jgi:hypothetical protein
LRLARFLGNHSARLIFHWSHHSLLLSYFSTRSLAGHTV